MDTVFLYRLIDAVQDSLDRVGREAYVLDRLSNTRSWLDLAELGHFLEETGHETVPLLWEGRALAPHDEWEVYGRAGSRKLRCLGRTGGIVLWQDALFAALEIPSSDGLWRTVHLVGERRPGGLEKLIQAFSDYARRRSRNSPWIEVIGGDPLPRPRGFGWDSLVLDSEFRDDLRIQVSSFFSLSPEYARMNVSHRRGLLFTGPPGNGKTSALRVIASVREEPFVLYALTTHTDKYDLDSAFDKAALEAPAVLCFEDVDSLFSDSVTLSHFLNRIDGIQPLEGVLIVATTNHPEKLDAALTERPSRFDRVFHFGNPAAPERRRYLQEGLPGIFDERLVTETEGFSMAQMKEVRVSACLEAIHAGLPGPTLAAAQKAIERLRGQKAVIEREWDPVRTIGFQWTR
jgi:hypothetical protein